MRELERTCSVCILFDENVFIFRFKNQIFPSIDTTPEASDNDEVSNNDEVIEDSNDIGEAENGHHKSDPDGSDEDADRSVGSTCTQEKETVLATAIAGNKKVSTSYPANILNNM